MYMIIFLFKNKTAFTHLWKKDELIPIYHEQ
jgi:hypothetical protein